MFTQRLALLNPYVPGEQPTDRNYIKLNANENPYPPSPILAQKLAQFNLSALRLYPDPDSKKLCKAIATMVGNGITEDMIFVGNGSDEVLSFIFFSLFDSNVPLLFPEHTYSFYPVYAGYYDIPFKKISLNNDFTINIDSYLNEDSSGIIFANPNAPTGQFLNIEIVRSLLLRYPTDKAIVVDEAYVDFAPESVVSLIHDFPNLVVVRTFSKGYCFAGSRLGYAIAQPQVIEALLTTKNSFNHFPVDALTQELGLATCEDSAYYKKIHNTIKLTRDSFISELRKADYDVLPSDTNFVMVKKQGYLGKDLYEIIKKEGILVRHFEIQGISDYIRITIGLPEHMDQLLKIMKALK